MSDPTPHKRPRQPIRDELRCAAKSKGTGERCRYAKVPGMQVCRYHGGLSKAGPANPAWKHGKHSILLKTLPPNLVAAAQEVLTNPAHIEMREHLGVLNAMLVDSISRWDAGAGELFPKLRQAWTAYRGELARGGQANKARLQEAMRDLHDLIETGFADYLARDETRAIIQDIRKVNETERKRLIDQELMMSADQVAVLVSQLVGDIRAEVADPEVLARLHRRFAGRLGAYREQTRAQMQ